MALVVSGSKYDELLKENQRITSNYNSIEKEVEQLREENKKLLSLKDRYSLNAETLQNENDDLKAALSLVREDVSRMQSEIIHLKEPSNQDVNEQELVRAQAISDENICSEITLESVKKFLLTFSASTLNDFLGEIIEQKNNEERLEQKRKQYMSQMLTVLNSVVVYAHKENKLLNLIKMSDPSTQIDDIKAMIETTKLYEIKRRDTFYSNTIDYNLLRTPKRPDESMHSFLVRILKYEKEYTHALSIYKEGVNKDEWNVPFNLNILKTFLKFKKILPDNTDDEKLKKDLERV